MHRKSIVIGFVLCLVAISAVVGSVAAWHALSGGEPADDTNTTDTPTDAQTPTETDTAADSGEHEWTTENQHIDCENQTRPECYNDVPPPTGTPTGEE